MQKIKQDEAFGLGKNLKKLRKRKNYTQEQVSAKLELYGIDISRVTYNKMEKNYYSIRVKELLALKEIFNCEFADFFEDLTLDFDSKEK